MAQERRVAALSRHLTAAPDAIVPRQVYLWITRDNVELRDRMLEHLKDPLYTPQYHLSLKEFRALTLKRLVKFTQQRFFRAADYIDDTLRFMAGLEVAGLVDYSLTIKAGVHFTLCGGSLCNLGTKKHHDAYLAKMDTLEERGCFAMTELGHGSNVMGIETTAVYEPHSDSFIINTPSNTASKFWIGGAGSDATISTVFAQLTVNGKYQGPHVFVVRLRDAHGRVLPGVRIKDNGPKAGLNGVDNGQIWFDSLRVPRDSLLDRYASVDASGNYSSPISSIGARFGTMVGGLTAGRLLIAQGAIEALKVGVTIALRYACARPQFGDRLIIDYLTHQRRLLPGLAATYAYQLAMLRLKALYVRKDPASGKLMHVMSSGIKAGSTWVRAETLQHCRECCGGQGFLAANKIGPMKNDMDVDQTFEGDNTVMMQQVAKALLDGKNGKSGSAQPPGIQDAALQDHDTLNRLLAYREAALTAEIRSAVQSAVASAGPSNAGAAAAEAYEDNMDLAVQLGWAYVDRLTFSIFAEELASAPRAAAPALRQLASLYGLTRVERGLPFLLASRALRPDQASAVRLAVNSLCRQLTADGGATVLALCDGFGVPDELLAAPIARDWTAIGA